MKRFRSICLLFIFAALCIFTASQTTYERTSAAKYSDAPVKVAFPVQAGMTFFDEDGKRSGYTYEYLQEVAQYTEWNYDFIDIESDNDNDSLTRALELIQSGEADIAGGWSYSEELSQEYGFTYSAHSYGSVETVLQARYDSDKDFAINSQAQQSFRIAIRRGASRTLKEVQDFCVLNKITPTFVYCDDEYEQMEALKKHESDEGYADLMVNTSMNFFEGLHTIARFAAKPFYFIVSTQSSPAVMQALDGAMIQIESSSPLFTSSLYEKYFSTQNPKLNLSDAEKQYIEQNEEISVGVLKDSAPYQYQADNTVKGITVDLMSYISETTGLKFSYVVYPDYKALYDAANKSSVRIIGGLTYDYELAARYNVSLSRVYLETQNVLMTRSALTAGDLAVKTQAAVEHGHDAITSQNAVYFPDVKSCIDAVAAGKADYTYADTYTAQYYLTSPEYNKLSFSTLPGDAYRMSVGVVKGGNKTLLGILNKALNAMTAAQKQDIVSRNLLLEHDFSLGMLIRAYPVHSVMIITGIAIVIVAGLAVLLVLGVRANHRHVEELSKHYRLLNLVSEYYLEYDYRTKKLLVSIPGDSDTNNVKEYDLNVEPPDAVLAQRRKGFMEFILEGDGIREACIDTGDGMHWVKAALETQRRNGIPLYTLGKLTFIDEEKQQETDLMELARQDGLTHLYNADAMRELLQQALADTSETESLSLLVIDIDYFKTVNDTLGHLAGDEALTTFARLLKELFPDGTLGRPGGDEFTVLLKDTGRKKLGAACAQLCARAAEISVSDEKKLSVSVGGAVAVFGETAQSFYDRADKALYVVKNTKRGSYHIASAPRRNTKK